MKSISIWLIAVIFAIVTLFIGISCKGEEAEEVAEEAEEVATEDVLTKDELYEELYGDLNGSELNYLGWQGYDGGESIKPFLDKYNITLNPIYIASGDEHFTKLKAGGGERYDISTPWHGNISSFYQNDLLEPLDLDLIPNFQDLFDVFKGDLYNREDGNIYSVPFTWGSSPICYNADEMEEPDSYDILLDPKYKGKVIVTDHPEGAILVTALWLGFDNPTFLTKDQLEKCYERLVELKANIRYIAPTFGDAKNALVSGEAWMLVDGWEAVTFWAQQEGANIKNAAPKEGTFAFIDMYGITKGAKNKIAAYAFINEMLDPEVQASWAAEISTATVNSLAVSFMDSQLASSFPYDNIDQYFDDVASAYEPVPPESDEYATLDDWYEMWERFKIVEVQ